MSGQNETVEAKIARFETWMKLDHVLIHFDSRKPGVELPAHLHNNPSVTLKLSYLFQGATEHDKSGITSFLRFNGQYERCYIPWDALWGITSSAGEQEIWPEDLPKELLVKAAVEKLKSLSSKLLGGKEEENPAGSKTPESAAERKKPQLRRIK